MAQLHEDLGLDRDDGLIFAVIPGRAVMMEHEYRFDDKTYATLHTIDDKAVDLVRADGKPVRFWQLKTAARSLGFNFPEPIWSGPAEEIKLKSLVGWLPEEGDSHSVALRAYQHGPWITLKKEDFERYA